MSSWASGYVLDVGYIHGFYRELTPNLLDFTCSALGQRRSTASKPLTYCELGCGQGFSLNLLAAANPHISFHGVDFNASQIVNAEALAEDAGLANIALHNQSFEDFAAREDLPQFDVIVLHGVYSWVSAANRRLLVEFVRRRLKAGGIAFVSYNALPGLADTLPLRQLMIEHAAQTNGPTVPRIDAAVAFATRMKEAGAGYFQRAQLGADRLDAVQDLDRGYLAHEYFNRDWTSFYHSQVASDLDEAHLTYVGSTDLLNHFEAMTLTPDQRNVLGEVKDPRFREIVRDFMTFAHFRRDVFVRGPVTLSAGEWQGFWLDQRYALTTPASRVPLEISLPAGEVSLLPEIYRPILAALSQGPHTGRELLARPDIGGLGMLSEEEARVALVSPAALGGQVRPCHRAVVGLAILVGAGALQPCGPSPHAAARESTDRFNAAVLRRSRFSSALQFLASPVTGGGVAVGRTEQLMLLAMLEGAPDPAEFARKLLIAEAGAEPSIENEARRTFASETLPLLRSLQVI